MEIKISTKTVLKILYVLAFIIFVGLCIEAGGFISNAVYTLAFNANLASHFWNQMDLSSLYNYDKGQFFTEIFLMSIVAVLKALLFYLIIKILEGKNLDFAQPFSKKVGSQISNLAYLTIGIGIFTSWGNKYTEWLSNKGIDMPSIQKLGLAGADVWLFMGVTLIVIAQIFKRGIEIQEENNLTI